MKEDDEGKLTVFPVKHMCAAVHDWSLEKLFERKRHGDGASA